MKVPQERYRCFEFYGDNNWHSYMRVSDADLSLKDPFAEGVADLNNQWAMSNNESINSQAGSGYYVVMSNSNYNVHSSHAIMYVTFYTNNTYTFKIMNRAEGNYDYPTITLSDGTTLYSNKANTTSFTSFTVSSAQGKTMTVDFRKDGSSNTDLDRAFLAIPNEISSVINY